MNLGLSRFGGRDDPIFEVAFPPNYALSRHPVFNTINEASESILGDFELLAASASYMAGFLSGNGRDEVALHRRLPHGTQTEFRLPSHLRLLDENVLQRKKQNCASLQRHLFSDDLAFSLQNPKNCTSLSVSSQANLGGRREVRDASDALAIQHPLLRRTAVRQVENTQPTEGAEDGSDPLASRAYRSLVGHPGEWRIFGGGFVRSSPFHNLTAIIIAQCP